MTLEFMGQRFPDVAALRKAFPAFCGEDALRAIRNGAKTPMEVEVAAWDHRNKAAARSRHAARVNATKANMDRLDRKAIRLPTPKPKRRKRKGASC